MIKKIVHNFDFIQSFTFCKSIYSLRTYISILLLFIYFFTTIITLQMYVVIKMSPTKMKIYINIYNNSLTIERTRDKHII